MANASSDEIVRRMSQRLSVASSTNFGGGGNGSSIGEKRDSPNDIDENTNIQLERCEKIRTKYPEVSERYFESINRFRYSNIFS